jgi:uncharacterized membrane protein
LEWFKLRLEGYHSLFVIGCLVLALVAAYPAFREIVPIPEGESFTELWILGPDHKPEGYPFNVTINNLQGPIYLGVRNRLGYPAYYLVYLKIRNQTQLPANRTTASPLEPVYESRFFLSNSGEWEKSVVFSLSGQPDNISNVSVNGLYSPLSFTSAWNSSRAGLYYQLFFELWIYDSPENSFQYHERSVGLWLNVSSV